MIAKLRIGAVLACLALTGAACTGNGNGNAAGTPGVTATTITIGSHQPLTGPSSVGYNEIAPASKAYFDFVNDHGGVHGRKIIYDYQDDAYDPANTVTVVHRLVENDKVFAIFNGQGTPTEQAVTDYLNSRKVPELFVLSGCTCWNSPSTHPYAFGWPPNYVREGKILGSYITKEFPGKRVAYFTQNGSFGQEGAKGLDMVVPASSVVIRQTYQPGYTDVTPQATAISQAKADVIVAFAQPAYIAQLRLAQQRLGNTAQLVVTYAGSDPATLAGLLKTSGSGNGGSTGNPLIQGIITDSWLVPVADSSNSWAAFLKTIHDRYLPTQPLDQNFEFGVAAAYSFVQALQHAGMKPTRQSLVSAINQGVLSPGFGLTPYDYSPTSHGGYTGSQIGVIRGDSIALQGQPLTTDDGNGPVTAYQAPLPQAPPSGIPSP